MMKPWATLFFVLLLASANTLLAGEVMKLTENDYGKTVEINVGDKLEIALPANPTTGYVWEVSSLDPTVLKQDKSEFLPGDKAIGSGGMEVIKLQAIGEGKSELKLIFHRPFERNKPPLKTFEASVIIKK
jgi:inhibitor of cysteine peptidase